MAPTLRDRPYPMPTRPPAPRVVMIPWHARSVTEVLETLQATDAGLSARDAAERLGTAGPNAIPAKPAESAWRLLVAQFRSVVVALLVIAAGIAAMTADPSDAVAIVAVLVLNVGLGFTMEMRARRAIEALGRLEPRRATVIRDHLPVEIDAKEVVPGDLLVLEEGQSVAADARLLVGTELRMNEAPLSGESLPVSKHPEVVIDADAPLPERRNLVFAGTTVASGAGRATVVATGAATEIGLIGRLVSSTAVEQTPLEKRLDALGRHVAWLAVLVGVVTAVLGFLQGVPTAVLLESAIALAVAAVPEGLPAVATITLALGVHRMARRHALVRRLPSVETLGSVTVLCTDKTGTLTSAAMTVTTIGTASNAFELSGEGYAPVGEFALDGLPVRPGEHADLMLALKIAIAANRADAVLTQDGWAARGDPTEAALIVAARKAGLERASLLAEFPEVAEVPFSSSRQLMATFHSARGAGLIACVKGAPRRVLALCTHVQIHGRDTVLDDAQRERLLAANRALAERGLRVLAVACGSVERAEESAMSGLSFVGLIGMFDPPAAGAKNAIQAFRTAGIRTVMITGDQRGTARAVARDLGLDAGDLSLDGRDMDRMSDEQLQADLDRISVFTRVSPEAKLRLIAAYQARGDIVAMIGDGVNDAAALKKSDVGVTMGRRGTDVARETADVVLEDDRFETIGAAIEEGRAVFDNINKFVFYLFSCNLAEIIMILGTAAAGFPLPLHPIQILWLNLVTDTAPALALALEPAEPGLMRRPPRNPGAPLVGLASVRKVAAYGLLIAAPALALNIWNEMTGVAAGRAMTMNFMVLAFAQLFHLGNARSDRHVLEPTRAVANTAALVAVAIVLLAQLSTVVFEPLVQVLHVEPLEAHEWMLVAVASLVPAVAGQAGKWLTRV